MSIYKIADVYIEITPHFDYTSNQLKGYLNDDQSVEPQITVKLTKEDLLKEYEYAPDFAVHYYESIAIYRKICHALMEKFNAIFFHCSALEYEGKAYVFAAPSGTGKSTHARMWRNCFGDKVTMINDDKPLIRVDDKGEFTVYGTPWDGKHCLSTNTRVPLHAICFLEQGKCNEIEKIDGMGALSSVLNQTIVPKDTQLMDNLLTFLERMLKVIPVYKMKATISDEAALIAYNTMK